MPVDSKMVLVIHDNRKYAKGAFYKSTIRSACRQIAIRIWMRLCVIIGARTER